MYVGISSGARGPVPSHPIPSHPSHTVGADDEVRGRRCHEVLSVKYIYLYILLYLQYSTYLSFFLKAAASYLLTLKCYLPLPD